MHPCTKSFALTAPLLLPRSNVNPRSMASLLQASSFWGLGVRCCAYATSVATPMAAAMIKPIFIPSPPSFIRSHSGLPEQRPDVGLADELRLQIGQAYIVAPAIGIDSDVVRAFVVAAVDQRPARAAVRSHFKRVIVCSHGMWPMVPLPAPPTPEARLDHLAGCDDNGHQIRRAAPAAIAEFWLNHPDRVRPSPALR